MMATSMRTPAALSWRRREATFLPHQQNASSLQLALLVQLVRAEAPALTCHADNP